MRLFSRLTVLPSSLSLPRDSYDTICTKSIFTMPGTSRPRPTDICSRPSAVACASYLLNTYADDFDLVDDVLRPLPATWAVQDLVPFLERSLRSHDHARRFAEVEKAVAFRLQLQASASYLRTARYVHACKLTW